MANAAFMAVVLPVSEGPRATTTRHPAKVVVSVL